MNLKSRLETQPHDVIWNAYCGFLDLSIDQYMAIQNRLMLEQIGLWSASELGKSILKGKKPTTIEEFRAMVPLTTYDDYADILLQKRAESLPENPIIWIQTTWEGGKHPIKVAPYTRSMLDVFRTNVTACLILATSTTKGKIMVDETDKLLYGLAPLPYATGLLPLALNEEIDIQFLPPVKDALDMTFSERNKAGFKMAMRKDVELFFGMGSVAYAISQSLSKITNGGSHGGLASLLHCEPKMIYRILKAKHLCKKENRELKPKDLFKLKGFMVAGTDNKCYKDELEALWGIRPMEIFAGTEPSLIGTETSTRNGMHFFPDACFYEFISEKDMYLTFENPEYQPKTYLMNEVIPGEKYEIVLSILKGGAFVRYRVGDVYRCIGLTNIEDETHIPRFEYVDRVPQIIDIAGFTRISEHSIKNAIQLSGLSILNWTAHKTYSENNRPFMKLYIEMNQNELMHSAVNETIIKEVLTTYFKYLDQDYRDLKKILGIDPLEITLLKCGSFKAYKNKFDKEITKINPTHFELSHLLDYQSNVHPDKVVM